MSAKYRYGDGEDCNFIPAQAISGTTPIVEEFPFLCDIDNVGLQLISTGTVTGTWLIEVSNNYVPASNGSGSYGQMAGDTTAVWSDITAGFSPAISNPAGSATNQYVQALLAARAMRITFEPASGAGNIQVLGFAKSFS